MDQSSRAPRSRSILGGAAVLPLLIALAVACTTVETTRKQCDEGDARACEAACEKGVAGKGGCFSAGRAQAEGLGVSKNEKRAAAFFARACEGGDVDGCLGAAHAYRRGVGVGRDPARALELDLKGCAAGSYGGCKEAGESFEAEERYDRAEELYAKGCKLLSVEPCAEVEALRKVRERREGMKREMDREAAGRPGAPLREPLRGNMWGEPSDEAGSDAGSTPDPRQSTRP